MDDMCIIFAPLTEDSMLHHMEYIDFFRYMNWENLDLLEIVDNENQRKLKPLNR